MSLPDLAPWQIVLLVLGLAFAGFVAFGMTRNARMYAPHLKALDEHAAEWARQHGVSYTPMDPQWLEVPRRTHPRGFSTTPKPIFKDQEDAQYTVSPDAMFGGATFRPTRHNNPNLGVEHVMNWQVDGMPVTAFQNRRPVAEGAAGETDSYYGKAAKFSYAQVVMTRLPQPLPSLALMPGNKAMRMAVRQLGYRDLKLESHDFNRQYLVVSSDDRFSYDALMPQTMEWLSRLDLGPEMILAVDGDWCRIVKAAPMRLEELQPHAEVLAGFVRSLPARVWGQ